MVRRVALVLWLWTSSCGAGELEPYDLEELESGYYAVSRCQLHDASLEEVYVDVRWLGYTSFEFDQAYDAARAAEFPYGRISFDCFDLGQPVRSVTRCAECTLAEMRWLADYEE